MSIEVRSLEARVGQGLAAVRPLRGLDLDVAAGEIVAVLGVSGSGKTTLLRVLSGQLEQVGGSVAIDGDGADVARRRGAVGCIFQDYRLVPFLTARENVSFALEIRGVEARSAWKAAGHRLDQVGLTGLEDRYPEELSGGQQQRVSIARALVAEPAVIVADEPSAALDRETTTEVMQVLKRIVTENQTSLVIATHDPLVSAFADVSYDLSEGRLVRVE